MKKRTKTILLLIFYVAILSFFTSLFFFICGGDCILPSDHGLYLDTAQYADNNITSVSEVLIHRIKVQPFNLVATVIFILAIMHTFAAHYFTVLSKRLKKKNVQLGREPSDSFWVEILYFMGEIEVIFGLWIIPLFAAMAYFYSWETSILYIHGIEFVEPLFVVVIMALAATWPIVKLADDSLRLVARLGGGSVRAWWWVIMTLGPLSGSLITEPGAMTISAMLLAKHFYDWKPSPKFAYATLGLLFTNVSVGGVLTNFAAPPVLMISKGWGWSTLHMMQYFGWKAILGILLANVCYYLFFKSEFDVMEQRKAQNSVDKQVKKEKKKHLPLGITMVHVGFLAWTVVHGAYPSIFLGSFFLFIGYYQATRFYQKAIELRSPILVGFFLAGLMVHGTLQKWWIAPVLGAVSEEALMMLSVFLTSFNDNAEVTFLASLIPTFDDAMKYAVVAGAVTGGGLTVIANAPNPTGQSILREYFHYGISATALLAGALFPTIIMGLVFYLLRGS